MRTLSTKPAPQRKSLPGLKPGIGSIGAKPPKAPSPVLRTPSPIGWERGGVRASLGPASAFTLMELVLAVGVTAIVLIAVNGVFFSAMRLRDSTQNAIAAALPTEQALAILRRDLQGAMPPYTNGVFAGPFRAGDISSTGLNEPVSIEWCTTTGVLRANEPWGEVQRVSYSLRPSADAAAAGKDLIRSVTRNLLSAMAPSTEDQQLLTGVQSIEFLCYDGLQWRDYWDTSLSDTNLPAAVRVRIQPAGVGDADSQSIEMLVPLDAQPRGTPTLVTANTD